MIDRRGVPIRVLLIADAATGPVPQSLVESVRALPCDVESRVGCAATLGALADGAYDVLLIDHALGNDDGLDTLRAARERGSVTPAIIIAYDTGMIDGALELIVAQVSGIEVIERSRLDISTFERALRYTADREKNERLRMELVEHDRSARADAVAALARTMLIQDSITVVEDSVHFQAHLLDAVEQAVIATDLAGKVTYWNRFAHTLYGWTAEEALGRNIVDLTPVEEVATGDAAAILERLKRGESWSGEFKVRHKNGGVFHAWVTNSPIFDAAGHLAGIVGISIDVTERRNADDALKASESFFRAAFASSAVASVLTSPEGMILRANVAFNVLVQRTEEELRGRHITNVMHSDDESHVRLMRERILSAEIEVDQHERRFIRRDGSVVDGLANVALVRRPDGEPLYFITQVVDISARIRAEAAVRQREEYLAVIVETQREIGEAPLDEPMVMHLISERARSLTHASGAIVELVDGDEMVYRAESAATSENVGNRMPLKGSLSGLCVEQRTLLKSPDMWNDDRVNQQVARRVGARSGIAVPLIYDGRVVGVLKVHSDRIEHFGENDERTLQLLAGIAGAALGHAADYASKQALVADRTTALDALRERELHFRTLIENADDPIIIIDGESTITYASPAIERLFGYGPEAVVGRNALGFVHTDDRGRAEDFFTRAVHAPEPVSGTELRMKHEDGSWHTVKSRSRNLLADPAVQGIVVNLTDITTEKLLAQQLRQSQKLEAVGQLAGGVAHDFNNLLTVIQIHGEFLAADIDSRDSRHADVQEIQKAATRAAGLTRQLLAFSRQQLLQLKVLDVNLVIASIAPMLRRLIGEDIEIVTTPGAGALRVLADPGQIEQVLMNLVINARDAMPRGGTIDIVSSIVDLDEVYVGTHEVVLPGRYVLLSVSDTGTGMDRRTRERIFEPFFTTKEPGQGTGLGLPTVYGIVKQSNGYVWVYSEPGLGTTFKIYLPLQMDDMPAESGIAASPLPPGNETVLLVEDDEAVRLLSRKILLRQGYRVLEARNGADGLAVARAYDERIHIVVSDVVMPEMNGRELVARITAERPGICALYMSGYTNDDILRRSLLDIGSRPLLQKPFTSAALAQAVRAALDG